MTSASLPHDAPESARHRADLAQTWLSEAEVVARLHIDLQTLTAWRRSRKLLAVWCAAEDRYLYPPCQFAGAMLIPQMEPLLGYLDYGVTGSGWDELEWLYAGNAYLDARQPVDVLPEAPSEVLKVAQQQFTGDPDAGW